jgi:hypothetical protein
MRNTRRLVRSGASGFAVDKIVRLLASEPSRRRSLRFPLSLLAAWLAVLAAVCGLAATEAAAQTPVDLELVVAVDVSLSMDLEEQRLQRDGYVAAFRDPELQRAIALGAHGRIAVTYAEWAGPSWQSVIIPWTVIDGPAGARAFADRLAAQPISRERLTSISGALQFARGLLARSGFTAARRVVDVSGDGPNNSGAPIVPVRDALVADGIVVNGLPIVLRAATPSIFDLADLDRYYAACVIGGEGAFMVPVKEIGELKAAIRRKLLMEVSGFGAEPLRPIPVQDAESEPYDCLVGERQWRWYLDDRKN